MGAFSLLLIFVIIFIILLIMGFVGLVLFLVGVTRQKENKASKIVLICIGVFLMIPVTLYSLYFGVVIHNSNKKEKMTPLVRSVYENDFEEFKTLLKKRNINKLTYKDCSPLLISIEKDRKVFVEYLIEKGADLNKEGLSSRITPLQYAIDNDNYEILILLLENGADVNHVMKKNKETVLYRASWKTVDPELFRILIKYKADINYTKNVSKPGEWGSSREISTPLLNLMNEGVTESKERLECVNILLDANVETNTMNEEGKTALDYAEEYGAEDLVNRLKEMGAVNGTLDEYSDEVNRRGFKIDKELNTDKEFKFEKEFKFSF